MSDKTTNAIATPQTQIGIAFDTAYLRNQPSTYGPSKGIYMIDNNAAIGSNSEGGMELTTVCHVGDRISWYVVPLNPSLGDKVKISGFKVSDGNVFGGNNGYPLAQSPAGDYWVGRIYNAGNTSYQPQVIITYADGTTHTINWDPFIIAK